MGATAFLSMQGMAGLCLLLLLQPLLLLEIFFILAVGWSCSSVCFDKVWGLCLVWIGSLRALLSFFLCSWHWQISTGFWSTEQRKKEETCVLGSAVLLGLLVFLQWQQPNNNSTIKIQLCFGRIFAFWVDGGRTEIECRECGWEVTVGKDACCAGW